MTREAATTIPSQRISLPGPTGGATLTEAGNPLVRESIQTIAAVDVNLDCLSKFRAKPTDDIVDAGVLMAGATAEKTKNIVLVHGGFVDGSGWQSVYNILKSKGFKVGVVQNPTTSLADDIAATKRVIAEQDGPVTLVGHSYGGAVITEAGNDPKVSKLVYIAAFAPDKGESVNALIKDPPPDAPVPPILPPNEGYLLLDKTKFAASFAGDLDADSAAFMADSQVPWGVDALGGTITEPAWKTKPSWYMVTTEDRMIPPPAQRFMSERARSTVVEVGGSHAIYVSKPAAVAAFVEKAASA